MDSLCITLLTGRRLPLLRRTVESLAVCAPDIFDRAHVIGYVNADDPESAEWLDDAGICDDLWHRGAGISEPIGTAVSRLVAAVPADCRYHLHLEDDWECVATSPGWLDEAAAILDADADVGQVRLRDHEERVMSRHMITGEPAEWRVRHLPALRYKVAPLHYTYNPSLCRVADLGRMHPADHENTAARNYMRRWPLVAQHVPGAFRHIGGASSRRASLGR